MSGLSHWEDGVALGYDGEAMSETHLKGKIRVLLLNLFETSSGYPGGADARVDIGSRLFRSVIL